ncbi:MAG: TRAP transporter small permease [Paracoccaceae bacterium]
MFRDESALGRTVHAIAKATALAGGAILIVITVLIVVSVSGRALIWAGMRPVNGDYELVSMGIGFAVFAFLPWAHLKRAHAIVTLVSDSLSPAVNRWILVVTDIMMMTAAIFIAWRLYQGMLDKFSYQETTLLLRIPLGWAYAAGLVGAVVFAITAIYVLGRSLTAAVTGVSEAQPQGGHL